MVRLLLVGVFVLGGVLVGLARFVRTLFRLVLVLGVLIRFFVGLILRLAAGDFLFLVGRFRRVFQLFFRLRALRPAGEGDHIIPFVPAGPDGDAAGRAEGFPPNSARMSSREKPPLSASPISDLISRRSPLFSFSSLRSLMGVPRWPLGGS